MTHSNSRLVVDQYNAGENKSYDFQGRNARIKSGADKAFCLTQKQFPETPLEYEPVHFLVLYQELMFRLIAIAVTLL